MTLRTRTVYKNELMARFAGDICAQAVLQTLLSETWDEGCDYGRDYYEHDHDLPTKEPITDE